MRRSQNACLPRARCVAGLPLTSESYPSATRGRVRARNCLRPEVVQLEDRQLLATFTVSSPLDTVTGQSPAAGTLRWAVEQADQTGGTNVINFSPTVFNTPQTITFGAAPGADRDDRRGHESHDRRTRCQPLDH